MKKLRLLLLVISTLSVWQMKGQGLSKDPLTPQAIFDTVFDKDANKYALYDLAIDNYYKGDLTTSISYTCNSGVFKLFFETGSMGVTSASVQATAVICQVFSDISNFINTPLTVGGNTTTVNFLIKNDLAIPGGVLGYATQFYTMPAGTATTVGGLVDGEVYKTILSGIPNKKWTKIY